MLWSASTYRLRRPGAVIDALGLGSIQTVAARLLFAVLKLA
jgi:hypothetical protein